MATPEQLARLHVAVSAALAAQATYGVPASVTLAQWIFESTWGTSELAVEANNFFGIKFVHTSAPDTYVEFPTAEYLSGKRVLVKALFERYPDEAASFVAHARLLAGAVRYRPAMLAAADAVKFAEQLQACHYSTSPTYAHDLEAAMHGYNLTQYDSAPKEGTV